MTAWQGAAIFLVSLAAGMFPGLLVLLGARHWRAAAAYGLTLAMIVGVGVWCIKGDSDARQAERDALPVCGTLEAPADGSWAVRSCRLEVQR